MLRPPPTQYLREGVIRGGIDLLLLAYRSSFLKIDDLLGKMGLGRAHHRVLYVLARRPGGSVKTLLDTLGITKQSVRRVLSDLMRMELVEVRIGDVDRRTRLLFLTESGAELEDQLFEPFRLSMSRAYALAGEEAVAGYWTLMQHLLDPPGLARFLRFNG